MKKKSFFQKTVESFKAIFGDAAKEPAHMMIAPNSAKFVLTAGNYQNWVNEAYKKNEIINGSLNLIANTFNEAEIKVVDGDGNHLNTHPAQLVLDHINDIDTQKAFFKRMLLYMYLGDNAFIEKVFDRRGRLTEIGLLRPDRIQILADNESWITAFKYTVPSTGKILLFKPEELIWCQFIDPLDRLAGFSPLKSLAYRIDIDNELAEHTKAVLENRGEPGSIIEIPEEMDPDAAKAMARDFDQRFTQANKGKTAVIHGGAKYQTFGMNFKDLEARTLYEINESRMLSTLGIPLPLYGSISGTSASTFDNMKTAKQNFWMGTIIPLQSMIAEYLNDDRDLISEQDYNRGIRIVFDTSDIAALKEEQDKLSDRARLDYQVGIITRNEARLEGGYDEIAEGDELVTQTQEDVDEEVPKEEVQEVQEESKGLLQETSEQIEEKHQALDNKLVESFESKPLIEGSDACSVEGMQENVRRLIAEGKSPDEAVAIAHSLCEASKEHHDEEEDVKYKRNILDEVKIATKRMAIADKYALDFALAAKKIFESQIADVQAILVKSNTAELVEAKSETIELDNLSDLTEDMATKEDGNGEELLFTIEELLAKWSVEAQEEISVPYQRLMEDSFEQASASVPNPFSIQDANVQNAINSEAFKFAEAISKTSAAQVRGVMSTAIAEGKPLAKIGADLSALGKQWDKIRVRAIARTETVRAANKGAKLGYELGGVVELRWSSVLDTETSEICQSLDGKVVGIQDQFIKNGESFIQSNGKPFDLGYTDGILDHPPAHVNCRSTIIPII